MYEVIKNLILTMISIMLVVKKSRFIDKFPKTPLGDDTCFIFGNGPSLNVDLKKCNAAHFFGDVWCVNQFGDSDMYEIVMPKHYVFADPGYWLANESAKRIAMREHLFRSIINKTNWKITIYAPCKAKKYFDNVFFKVTNISLVYYNSVPVRGVKQLVIFFYKRGLGMPLAQNVLGASLFLSIRRGYKHIYLLGADHSWHETLQLDDVNRVCFIDRHFYNPDGKLVPCIMGGDEQQTFTMPQLFFVFAKTFEAYWKVKEYADCVGAEICNASSVSFIDAFRRIKFSDLLGQNFNIPFNISANQGNDEAMGD